MAQPSQTESKELEAKIELVKKWIRDIRVLGSSDDELLLHGDNRAILEGLAHAAEDLIGGTNNYDETVGRFSHWLAQAREIRELYDIEEKCSHLLTNKTIIRIFSFIIGNIWQFLSCVTCCRRFKSHSYFPKALSLEELEKKAHEIEREKTLAGSFGDIVIDESSDRADDSERIAGRLSPESDGLPFIVKAASKNKDDESRGLVNISRLEFVNEFITSPFYERTLFDRSPVINEVEEEGDRVFFRSRFLHDFETISHFTNSNHVGEMGDEAFKLSEVGGFEDLIASMLLWGESNMSAGNVGIMNIPNPEEEEITVFAKLNLGNQQSIFYTNAEAVFQNLFCIYENFGYAENVSLNIDALIEAIDQNIISDEEIEDVVEERVTQLEGMEFDINGLVLQYDIDETTTSFIENYPGKIKHRRIDSFDNLKEFYTSNLKTQMKAMREVKETLEILSRDYSSPAWKNGGWLKKAHRLMEEALRSYAYRGKPKLSIKQLALTTDSSLLEEMKRDAEELSRVSKQFYHPGT